MARRVKEILRPGVYTKGGDIFEIGEREVAQAFASIAKLAQTNLDVPVILEHVQEQPGQKEGVPLRWNDRKADELSRTVGRSVFEDPQTRINERGGLDVVIDVPDDVAAKMDAGYFKFVSPELRPFWRDGIGREYEGVPTHIAITHRPIQVDQEPGFRWTDQPPAGAQAIALSDSDSPLWLELESETTMAKAPARSGPAKKNGSSVRAAVRANFAALGRSLGLADDDGDDDGDSSNAEESGLADVEKNNPDVKSAAADPEFEATLANLEALGLSLPVGISRDDLISHLLTATKTLLAARQQEKDEEREEQSDEPGSDARIEEVSSNGIQFSDNSPRGRLCGRIRSLRARGLKPETADRLLTQAGSVQFSSDGREVGGRITSALDMFEEQLRPTFNAGTPQARYRDRIVGMRDAKKIDPGLADQLLARIPSVQFSDNGNEIPNGGSTLKELLDAHEQNGASMAAYLTGQSGGRQLSDADEARHPSGERWASGNEGLAVVGSEEAKTEAAKILERHRIRPRSAGPVPAQPPRSRQLSTHETIS